MFRKLVSPFLLLLLGQCHAGPQQPIESLMAPPIVSFEVPDGTTIEMQHDGLAPGVTFRMQSNTMAEELEAQVRAYAQRYARKDAHFFVLLYGESGDSEDSLESRRLDAVHYLLITAGVSDAHIALATTAERKTVGPCRGEIGCAEILVVRRVINRVATSITVVR